MTDPKICPACNLDWRRAWDPSCKTCSAMMCSGTPVSSKIRPIDANARLIAASPDLLAALKRLEAAQTPMKLGGKITDPKRIEAARAWQAELAAAGEAARAAIAKAEGKDR